MSLIEQAAKRLEELRRSGADLSVDAGGVVEPEPAASSEPVPTPEAVVRALEARGEPMSPPPGAPVTARSGRAGALPADRFTRPAAKRIEPVRQIEIDLARLKTRGYVTPDSPETQVAGEFRVIKRPIIDNALGKGAARPVRNGNLVMITSALPREGKTFTAVNLAISIAMELDNTVLLVDGDVAYPALPSLLGVPQSPGLLDLLTNQELDVSAALVRTNVEKLTVIPVGTPHRHATELLASEQMAQLLKELASRYSDRIILFDSPPLLVTTEARVLASHMGQIVMVVAAETTSQSAVTQALGTIEGCENVLMMLNKASRTVVGTYGYYTDDSPS